MFSFYVVKTKPFQLCFLKQKALLISVAGYLGKKKKITMIKFEKQHENGMGVWAGVFGWWEVRARQTVVSATDSFNGTKQLTSMTEICF